MASNSTSRDPATTTNTNININITTTNSMVTAVTTTSPARPLTSISTHQVPSVSQPRPPQFLQHQQQHLHHQHQQHGVFNAQAQTQTQTQTQTHSRPQVAKEPEPFTYPLASSGRGLLPTPRGIRPQLPDHTVTVANPGAYSRPLVPSYPHLHQHQHQRDQHQRAGLFGSSDSPHSSHLIHPPYLHPSHGRMSSFSAAPVRGTTFKPHPTKAIPSQCSAPDSNGHKDPADKGTNDNFVTIRDRKVRILDGASIYALCRSWLRNGSPEENQAQYGDVVKSLPKPLPMPIRESSSPVKKESDEETEADEGEKPVQTLHEKDLLQMHIKRAKRVRARLREERLQRIARYKSRLALLLPPLVEQCRNDASTGT